VTSAPGADSGVHVLAVVDDGALWVDETGALPRLEADWPTVAELVPERADLVPVAPRAALPGATVHVLVPRVPTPPPGAWSARPAAAVAESPEVLDHVALEAARWRGQRPRPARRQPWYVDDWLPARTAWVDEVLAGEGSQRTDEGRVLSTWPLSTVVRFAARDRDGAPADVVLKGCCDYFAAEPVLTACVAGIAPTLVVETLAVDAAACTLLLRAFPEGASEPTDHDLVTTAAGMARLQLDSLERRPQLLAAGCPDRRLGATRDGLLRELGPTTGAAVVDDLARLEALGPPAAVVHGDLHRGNVTALPDGSLRVFDWSDTCWAHPGLDVAHLVHGLADEVASEVWRAWGEVWAAAGIEVDVEGVRRLAPRVDDAHQLLTYRTPRSRTAPPRGWAG
jgi:hypothetical protein